LGEGWKALSEDDKAPYQTKHKELKKVADAAIAEYEAKHGKAEKKTKKKKDGAEKKKKKKKAESEDDDDGGDDDGDDE